MPDDEAVDSSNKVAYRDTPRLIRRHDEKPLAWL